MGVGRWFTRDAGNQAGPRIYSNFLLYQPGFASSILQLKNGTDISISSSIRAYTPLDTNSRIFAIDKDLDSNVYYGCNYSSRIVKKYTLNKGLTTFSSVDIGTIVSNGFVLGLSYAKSDLWDGNTNYGAIIIGDFSSPQRIIISEFLDFTKTSFSNTYTVDWNNGAIYGTETIPKTLSGFNNHYAVAMTQGSAGGVTTATNLLASWTINMTTRSWTNFTTTTYTSGTNGGPINGGTMIHFPIGKPIFTGDTDISTNRILLTDSQSAFVYIWTVTESGNALVWTWLKNIAVPNNGGVPYLLSQNAYDAIS